MKKFEEQRVADKFKSMYLQSIAHDLRTPLNTIMSMNEHVMSYYKNDLMVQSTMKLSISSCLYLILIVDQVQELSKFQMNLFKLDVSIFNFRETLRNWLENIVI